MQKKLKDEKTKSEEVENSNKNLKNILKEFENKNKFLEEEIKNYKKNLNLVNEKIKDNELLKNNQINFETELMNKDSIIMHLENTVKIEKSKNINLI